MITLTASDNHKGKKDVKEKGQKEEAADKGMRHGVTAPMTGEDDKLRNHSRGDCSPAAVCPELADTRARD